MARTCSGATAAPEELPAVGHHRRGSRRRPSQWLLGEDHVEGELGEEGLIDPVEGSPAQSLARTRSSIARLKPLMSIMGVD